MRLPRDEVRAKLPQIVIGVQASLAFLPKSRPTWQVEVYPMNVWQRLRAQRFLNRATVVRPSDYPNFMEACDLANPVPTYARLRTPIGLTRISRNKYAQGQ